MTLSFYALETKLRNRRSRKRECMDVYNKALKITETVISNNVSDRTAAIRTVTALDNEQENN